MPQSNTINFQHQNIHYLKYGNGDKVILAFHGFGQQASDFELLANAWHTEYTTYAFDLFYHGKSYWNERDTPMTKEYWTGFISYFLNEYGIKRFSVCGFSLGGKFAIATLEAFAPAIDEIILLAPDGIKTNPWYSLATYPGALKQYFRSMIVKPNRFFRLINMAKRLGVVDKGILKFAASQMNTRKKRRRVYYAWVVFKNLYFDMPSMAALINDHNITLRMYLGTHDKIITQKGMSNLLNHLDDYDLHIIDSGHNHLIEKVSDFIAQKNNQKNSL